MRRSAGIISRRGRRVLGAIPALLLPLILALALVFISSAPAGAADTGWHSPSDYTNWGWTNPQNAYASDNSRAEATDLDDIVDYRVFGLGIPSGSTIQGIQVSVEGYREGVYAYDWFGTGPSRQVEVTLSWNNGSNYTSGAGLKTSSFGTTETTQTFGTSSDTWNHSWTAEELSDATFRVRLDCTACNYAYWIRIDHVQVRVYYTLPTTSTAIATSGTPSTYGDNVTFTATVTRGAGTNSPSGTVTFMEGATTLGTGTLSGGGASPTATFSTTTLAVGTHSNITAVYGGDSNFQGSTSTSITQVVNTLAITVTADSGQGKDYGDADPTLTYTNTPSLPNGDTFSGALSRAAGENVGTYAISQGTLSLSSNYTITYIGANFAITPLDIAVTADAKSKDYGGSDPALTYTYTPSLIGSDTFSGALSRVAGENAGTYAINQGTLSLSSNYTITYVGANLTIDPLGITVTADAKSKTYGDADPALTYTYTPSLIGGDTFSGALSRVAGENAGTYAITQGTLSLSSNYTITYVGANLTISPLAITVTADAGQAKVYGDADPALTYTYTPSLIGSDSFSGALSRAAGENVGTYAITQGTLTAGANYSITFVPDNFAITTLAITVTADAQSKDYGDADPALTYTYTPSLVGSDTFSGTLSRAAGEDVGTYAITQGTLALSGNYTITYVGANLTISPLAITVTADAQSKDYGDADPALTYTYTPSLVGSDTFSGALSRAAGEDVGTYAITQGTLSLSGNYTITYVGANLTISPLAITVTADAQGKDYGDADPALTYTYTPSLIGSDTFSGSLSRAAGENVGTYAITQGTLALSGNYTITFVSDSFAITTLAITVTADAQGKDYGDADPALTYTYTPSLVGSDTFSGALSRAAGENVGTYAINQGTLALSSNYTITYVGADLTISPLAITVTADAKSKTYGDADPALTYTYAPALIGGDSFSGALSRAAGENVGTYAITQGTLALSGNYTITYVGANLTISPLGITVTADAGQTKVYGDADPALTYSYTPGLVGGDTFSGSLSRAAGENVGTYAITQGTLALSGNYTITFVSDSFAITTLAITVTADAQGKDYGDADPALTYTYTPSLIGSDAFTGSLSRAPGENVGTYAITQGTLALSSNYTITYVGADLTISPLAITVTADAQGKDYGDADPALTYSYAPALVGGDSFSGSLSRAAGEDVGTYAINQGTLALSGNYTITYVGANLTITPLAITVTADAQGKDYGDADPALTYTYTPSLIGSDTFSGALSRAAGENVGTYAITQGTLALSGNYTITYVGANLTISPLAITVTADAKSKTYGDADPALTYTYTPSLIGSDTFSGALSRVAGEDVGTYAINQGTLALSSNYTITYVGANLTISPLAVTVTADAQSKDYGDADPALTYTYTPALIGSDTFSGALSRAAGEDAGIYAITQGTLALSSNYTITFVSANLTISPLAITVTADAKSKTYGDADPALTYTYTPSLIGSDTFSGALSRVAGEDVGTYAINQGTLALSSNYTITYVGANLTISPLGITVTADAQGKTYGDADPALTYTYTPSLIGSDTFSGALSRAAGENAGTYAISPGTLSLSSNYTITYVGANLTISPLAITVTADAQSKDYGDADPSLTHTYTPSLIGSDTFSGALSRAAGENAGTYAINQGTLSLSGNYTITYVGANLTISPLSITVTADAQGKDYGDADPALTYTYTPSLIGSDTFSGALSRAAGENVGTYAITQGTLALSGNYSITYVGANLTISPLAITVTADAQGKDYGDADPALTYTYTPSLVGSDSFSGALSRVAGEDAGTYAITQGTLSLSSNYTITYVGANLTISPLAIAVTADAKIKTYGDADPALTYTYTPSLVGSDSFSGALSRAAGENVGTYAIAQGTLTAGSNYTITYVGANLTISPLAITVTADAQGKDYGDADPALTYTYTPSLIGSDSFSGALARAAGENAGTYAIGQGTLALSGNYTITYVGADLTISPLAITVTADAKIKIFGDPDPALTYTYTPSLVGSDTFSGSLSRVAGEDIGTYAINQGTLALSGNYTITYVGANLTITPPVLTITTTSPLPDATVGVAYSQTLTAAGGTAPYTWSIDSGTLPDGLTLNASTGEISGTPTTAGGPVSITFMVTDSVAGTATSALSITVVKGTPTITWPNPADIVYGTALSGTQLNATASVPGSFVYTPASGTLLNAGSGQTLHVDFTPTDTANYNSASADVTINVTPLEITVTADAQGKDYGDADPALAYTYTPSLVGSDSFSGALSRAAGENVGTYAITQGTLALSGNYTITYVGANLTISPLAITVTADAQGKDYGDADPALTYTYTPSLIGSDTFSGALSRAAGENVGTYAITQGTLALSSNYTITYVGANLTISPLGITVTADAQGKDYGDADPALTYTYTPLLVGSDSFSGALSRVAGEDAGIYAITQGTLALSGNYTITYVGADLTISPLAITVTADAKIKIFGDPDPALTYTYTPSLVGSDTFSGSLSRVAGEDIGTYAITQGTLALSGNYTITYVGANLTITPPVLTITSTSPLPDATVGSAYSQTLTAAGGTAPYTWSIDSGTLPDGLTLNASTGEISGTPTTAGGPVSVTFMVTDSVAGTATSALSITVDKGTPTITWPNPADIVYGTALSGTQLNATASVPGAFVYTPASGTLLNAGSGQTLHVDFTPTDTANYNSASADVTINVTPLEITVTADAQGKDYGDADPALAYTYTPSLIGSDTFSGALSRAAGENVGTYAIGQGTLALSGNYTITYVGADLTISPLAITVTADAKIKIFGDPDPALTYTYTPSLVGSDTFSGALSRAAGEDIGTYAINQGTLALSGNYTITYVGANLTITPPVLTITTTSPLPDATVGVAYSQTLTAAGGTAPYTWSIDSGTLPDGLTLNASTGEISGTPTTAGGPVSITFMVTDSVAGTATSALSITVVKGTPTITWPNPADIVYGTALSGTQLNATASVPGAFVYTPASGTLLNAGSGQTLHVDFTPTDTANYNSASADVTINVTPLEITVTADAQGKDYGDADPALAYTYTPSLIGSDTFSGSLSRTAGENAGTYAITQGTLALSGNYTITYVGADLTISPLAITVTADAKGKDYGDADPALTYTYTPSLVGSDTFSGTLSRAAGEDIGTYAITQGTLALSGNYAITYVGASLTISPLAITVTADAQSKIYGDVDPPLTYTYIPSLVGSDTFSGSLSRVAGEDIGTYAITQGTLALSGNYTLTYVGASLTINAAPLTITSTSPLPDATVGAAYSQTLTAVGGTLPYTWSVDSGSLPDGLSLAADGVISGTPTTAGGPASITFRVTDGAADSATVVMSITVVKGTPTITWDNPGDIVYGTALSGTQLNATASVPGAFVYTPASGTQLDAGSGQTLHVDFTPTDTANYNSASADVTINVTPLAITVTADAQGKTYGDADPALTYTCTPSLVGSDTFSGALSRDAGENVGTYTIAQGTLTAGANYSVTYVGASLTVSPRALTITADDLSKAFGDTLTFTGTEFAAAGLVNSDIVDSITLTSAGADASAAIGDYDIFASAAVGAGLSNYTITYANGTLSVRTGLTIIASDSAKTYGDTVTFAGTEFTVIGLQGSDNVTSVTLSSSGSGATAAAGTYDIVPGGAVGSGLENYHITYVNGTLTVGPRALTVTADNRSKTYGDTAAFSGTEFTVTGLVNSDAVTGASFSSPGTGALAAAGTYDIVPSAAVGTGLGNYSIAYANGTLTVDPRDITITAPDSAKTYGNAATFAGTEFAAIGLVNSDTVTGVTLTSAGAEASAAVGGYAVVPSSATGSGLGNYRISYVNGTLTVGPRPLAITASNRIKGHGSTVTFAGTEFVAMGLVNSDAVTSVTLTSTGAGAAAAAGTYDIVPAGATGSGLENYAITYSSGTLTVGKAGVIWTVTSSPASSAPGSPVTLTATVSNTEATGTVTFRDGGTVLGTGTLSNGVATFTTSDLSVGSHYITVSYDGDVNFADGASLAHIHTVKAQSQFNWWWIVATAAAAGGFFFFLILYRRRKRKEQEEAA